MRALHRPVARALIAVVAAALCLAAGAGVATAAGSTTTTAPDDAGATTPALNSTVPPSDPLVSITTGLTYYADGPPFDAYIPNDGRTDRPALILVHGGGWQGGNQTELAPYALDAAQNEGWAAFTVNYRLDSHDPSAWAGELHDIQSAIRYIVGSQGRRYGIDPDRVVLLGDSAGANLVALVSEVGTADPVLGEAVGYDPSLAVPIKAVALWSPPTDLAALVATAPATTPPGCGTDEACDFTWSQPAIVAYIGCQPSACPERYRQASPIDHVSASTAPSYVANSTDELVPLDQVQQYVHELEAAGVPNQFDVLQGDLHAAQNGPRVWPASVAFLATRVAAPADATGTPAVATAASRGSGGTDHRGWVAVGAAVLALAVLAGVVVAVVEHRRKRRRGEAHDAP